jgi:hypothetical protein
MREKILVWVFVAVTLVGAALIATTAWEFGAANKHLERLELLSRCESAQAQHQQVIMLNRISSNLGLPMVHKVPEVPAACADL